MEEKEREFREEGRWRRKRERLERIGDGREWHRDWQGSKGVVLHQRILGWRLRWGEGREGGREGERKGGREGSH